MPSWTCVDLEFGLDRHSVMLSCMSAGSAVCDRLAHPPALSQGPADLGHGVSGPSPLSCDAAKRDQRGPNFYQTFVRCPEALALPRPSTAREMTRILLLSLAVPALAGNVFFRHGCDTLVTERLDPIVR